jgi:transposase-like protein
MNLTDPIFHDDEAARVHLEAQRWPNGPYCPHCGEAEAITRLAGKTTRPGICICKSCRTKFSVTVGTIFERSHIGLAKWTLAFRLMASSKKGMSALQLERTLGVTYKTAWFMAHRIREAMREPSPAPLGGPDKIVEADETYMGGKDKNRHKNKRQGAYGGANKAPVLTLVERNGEARSFHLASVTSKQIRPLLVKHASRKSHLMTDGPKPTSRLVRSSPRMTASITPPKNMCATAGNIPTRSRASSPSSKGASMETSTPLAKPTFTVTLPSSISATITASRSAWTIPPAPMRRSKVHPASA